MSSLQPYARVIDCTTNAIIGTTSNILDYEIQWQLDSLGTLSVTIGAGDPGDATTSTSFAEALLEAANDLGSSPKPLLLEFSLDGGTSFDSRRVVRNPVRSLQSNQRTIVESGTDVGDILGSCVIERATYVDITLSDALSGNPSNLAAGTIVPLTLRGLMRSTEPIPYLTGIFVIDYSTVPGLSAWASGARNRLKITAVINPAVQNIIVNVDSDSDTVLGAAQTIVNRLAGAASDQSYGHWVLDVSDAALNLSSTTSFSPAPTAISNAFVVGNQGTTAHLTFDATASTDVDETTTARVHLDACTVQTDDSMLYAAANMVGGRSTAGFPESASVTALAVLNGSPPAQSSTKDQWYDDLPVIGISVSSSDGPDTGGVFHSILDGRIIPLPNSPSLGCHSLGVDTGDAAAPRSSALYMGTAHGVYYTTGVNTTALYPANLTWHHLDGLDKDVLRIHVDVDPADTTHNVLTVLVRGTPADWDGVWRYTNANGWQPHLLHPKIVDVVTTDYKTAWMIDETGKAVKAYALTATGTKPATGADFPSGAVFNLPSGVQAVALERVVTVAHDGFPAQDSIWVRTTGASGSTSSPAYYLLKNTSGEWLTPWIDANVDGTFVGPDNNVVHCYTVIGSGVTIDSTYGGPVVNVMAGTDLGALWSSEPLGGNLSWKLLDLGAGLGNYMVKKLALGEGQVILGKPLNRVFAATDDDVLYSSSSGRWWETIKGRDRTLLLPYLTNIYLSLHGTLVPNNVRTWGSTNADGTAMTASPLGLSSGTHVHIAAGNAYEVPRGYYFERFLDQHQEFQTRIVSQTAVLPGTQLAQLSQLQATTSLSSIDAASGVADVMKRWIRQHSLARTHVTIESSFSSPQSILRTTRPTHRASITGAVAVQDVSSTGAVTNTSIVNFDPSQPYYVISHDIKMNGNTATTTTVLSPTLLEAPPDPSALMAAQADELRNLKVRR